MKTGDNLYKLIKFELMFLKKYLFLFMFLLIILVLFNLIIIKNIELNNNLDIVKIMYGNVNKGLFYVYWIYIILLYLIILTVVWRPVYNNYDMNVILRFIKIKKYWNNKFIIHFIITILFVVLLILVTVLISFLQYGILPINNKTLFLITVILILNFILHGEIWLFIKNVFDYKIATFIIFGFYYLGTRLPNIKSLLHFGLYKQLLNDGYNDLEIVIIILIKILFIFLLKFIISVYQNKQDIYIKLL